MDILKLLSRSTKQPNKASAAKNNAPQKFPSAGTSENPQLYHDVVLPDSRGKKRKRGAGSIETAMPAKEGDSIDFFASTGVAPNAKVVKKVDTTPSATQETQQDLKSKLLEEGECRQILKSHRVKVSLLPGPPKPEPKLKKSKRTKESEKPASDGFTQIFPQPLQAFSDLRSIYGISGRMAENLVQQGYKIPTEVQMGSLPMLVKPSMAMGDSADLLATKQEDAQVDLLAVAPTGSGKTLAFLIPIVNQIIQRRRKTKDGHSLDAIVIAPTKELASQIVNEAKKLCLGTGVRVVGMKKGMRIVGEGTAEEQHESASEDDEDDGAEESTPKKTQPVVKADILITTPGLLLSTLSNGSSSHTSIPTVTTLVLDEADVLLDQLFRDQTLGIWNACTNPNLRVTLWSATMGSSIESLASSTIYSRRALLDLPDSSRPVRLVVGLKDSAIPNITHKLTYAANEPGKLLALRQLLHPTSKSSSKELEPSLRPPFLVFTQTIPRAIALHSELLYDIPAEAGGSTRIAVLHSDLSDSARDSVMTRFRNGEVWILITTDILSRGVDFRGVNGVVNYDVPNSSAAYIHRVGRTGRAGRDGGIAVTLYTKEDIPNIKSIANIIAASEKQAGKAPSEASVQKWFLDALPTPSKNEKKKLKMHGVEARRSAPKQINVGKDRGKGRGKVQISTKSGYERKMENNRKGAIRGSQRRAALGEGGEEKTGGRGGKGEMGVMVTL